MKLFWLLIMLYGGARAEVALTAQYTFTGPFEYVTTGASFRTNADSTTAGDSCRVATTATGTVSGIPIGAEVQRAILYWAASNPTPDTEITFAGTTVNATRTPHTDTPADSNNYFLAMADVTNIVKNQPNPNTSYTMSGLSIQNADTTNPTRTYCSRSAVVGGWGMYIVYSQPTLAYKKIIIYDGLDRLYDGAAPTITLTGLDTQASGEGRISILLFEGDEQINNNGPGGGIESGSVTAGGTTINLVNSLNRGGTSNGVNLGFANSSVSTGSAGTAATPATGTVTTYGVDFDTFNLTGRIPSGLNELGLNVSAGRDFYLLASTAVAATTTPPSLTITKTDNGQSFVAGGTGSYTATVTNATTLDDSVTYGAITVRDTLPTGLSYKSVTTSTPGTFNSRPTAGATGTVAWTFTPTTPLNRNQTIVFELIVDIASSTPLGTDSIINRISVGGGGDPFNGGTAPTPGNPGTSPCNVAHCSSDTTTVVPAPTPLPAPNPSSYPATCDLIDWATSGVSGTALSGTRTFNSRGGRSINLNLTSATGAGNGIMGYSASFANYGSWYEVRAVSESIQPVNTQAFLTRAGGAGNPNNTIVITFPTPVINVRLGITDLDAVGGSAGSGDWAQVQASYGGQTFNPDVLVGGGHALAVQAYTGVPSGAGAAMTVSVPGLGNSQMRAASASPTYNTLMGVDAAYGAQVSGFNRQGQGVAYFKGPLTSITITTGSLKGAAGQGIAFSNIDFCPPSLAVDKAAGTPVRQADSSYDVPYTLTYRNTSLNVGYYPDATVRDAIFSPSIPTPTGADPWARQRPQLTDAALDQIRANTNVAAATLRAAPTVSGATNTVNLDASDVNTAFSGTAANPNLLLANTDGRVDVGGSFSVNFTVNVRLGSAVTTDQTVNNRATATASLFTGSLTATSNTVASSLTPGAALSVIKVADQALIRYPLTSGASKLRYTITVTNTSGLTATGVQLTDTLPASLPYAASESGNTPPTTRSGQTLTWSLGDLAPSASRSVVVFVDVPTASSLEAAVGTPQTAIVNTADAQATNAPAASGSVPVNTLYTRLFKQVRNLGPQGTLTPAWGTSASGRPGDVLEYCIDVANLGSAPLANYQISDVVPANTTLVAGSATVRQGRMDNPGAAVPGVTVADTDTIDSAGRTTRLLRTSALTLAPGAQVVLCFRAAIR